MKTSLFARSLSAFPSTRSHVFSTTVIAWLVAVGVLWTASVTSAASSPPVAQAFPYVIPVITRADSDRYNEGDQIVITQVRGDRASIEVGGTYLVEGVYTFGSAAQATLALSLTASSRANASSRWSKDQFRRIDRGAGSFAFVATMHTKGAYHVSFYPAEGGSSQSGVYFYAR